MQKVNYHYDIKNQWCATSKQHFGLRFPGRFQRATALDIRDKTKEEREADDAAYEESRKMSPVKLQFGKKTDVKQDEIKEKMRVSLAAKKQRGLTSIQQFADKKKKQQPSFGKY
jgi:hypothetical protein